MLIEWRASLSNKSWLGQPIRSGFKCFAANEFLDASKSNRSSCSSRIAAASKGRDLKRLKVIWYLLPGVFRLQASLDFFEFVSELLFGLLLLYSQSLADLFP